MKKLLLTLACVMSICGTYAQSLKFQWLNPAGGPGNEVVNAVTTDNIGGTYVVGTFEGTVDFDPTASVFSQTSLGYTDIFIAKYDVNGYYMWSRSIGGLMEDTAHGVYADDLGNVYITGSFNGLVDFDPTAGLFPMTSIMRDDIFVVKLDPTGQFIWAKQMGGGEEQVGYAIGWDNANGLYTTGSFKKTVDFNPGFGVENHGSAGDKDIFLSKLDGLGNHQWARTYGSDSADVAYALAASRYGYIYLTGSFKGKGDFDPGAGVNILSTAGKEDIFISVFDHTGISGTVRIGGPGVDIGRGITFDQDQNYYVTGTFSETVDFNPGAGVYNLTARGTRDVFILKFNPSGGFIWARNLGALAKECVGTAIRTDVRKNVFVTGYFSGTMDVPRATDTMHITSNGNTDVFLAKLNDTGAFQWVKTFGGDSTDIANSLAVNLSGSDVYVGGSYTKVCDFNPGSKTFYSYAQGNSDLFLEKLTICDPIYTNISDTACTSYRIDATVYTESGTYHQLSADSATGCDKFITLDLFVKKINDTVTVSSSGVLTAKAEKGLKYQWIECTTKKVIPGATSNYFIPLGNGNYAVVIKNGSCIDTSACHKISDMLDIKEYSAMNSVNIYPNPSSGEFTIRTDDGLIGAQATVYNVLGQKVRSFTLTQNATTQTLDKGFYIVEIAKGDEKTTQRLIVN